MSNSHFEKAKDEASRLAKEMGAGVKEGLKEGLGQRTAARGGRFALIVHQLRTAHLVALAMQIAVLYFDLGKIGLARTTLPIVIILLNACAIGRRWYLRADGRSDYHQLVSPSIDPVQKARYAFALFGALALAMLAQSLSPTVPSAFGSILYRIAGFSSVVIGCASAGIEVYEGIKESKTRE